MIRVFRLVSVAEATSFLLLLLVAMPLKYGADAPLAYALSVASGLIYVVATFALATDRRTLAWVTVLTELVGVLAVGTASLVAPDRFPDETVWSTFGQGYGWVPLVLPLLGVIWLRRTGRPAAQ